MAAEGAPIIDQPENSSEKSSDKEDKKKKRRGHLVVARETRGEEPKKPERGVFGREKEEKEPKLVEDKPEKPVEAETASAEDAPEDTIGEKEVPVVESNIVPLIRQQNAELPPDPDTDPVAERFLELVEDEIGSRAAEEQVYQEFGINEEELETLESEIAVPSDETETETEAESDQTDEELVFDRRAEETFAEEEPEDPVLAAGGPTGPAATGAGGGATPPPVPPTGRGPVGGGGNLPPNGPAGPGGPNYNNPFGPGGPGGFNPNAVPAPAAANQANVPRQPEYHYPNAAASALLGGIIGYLIGRRRGRIKTEKKLLPIQKKLEKQVTNLQFELQEKEKKIRRVAAAKVSKEGPAVLEVFRKAPEERRRAPEARALHIPQNHQEHIGQVLMAAEAKPAERRAEKVPEQGQAKIIKQASKINEKRVESLNRAELLGLSEKIIVDGSSLRQIYESHLIGERGLRRLVGEHLRGGDLKKALRMEVVEREIDFERDPGLRDMAPPAGNATGGGKTSNENKTVLDDLLEKASANVGDNSEEAAYFKARAAYDAQQYSQQKKHQQLMDVSLIATIAVLLGVVIVLFITRG